MTGWYTEAAGGEAGKVTYSSSEGTSTPEMLAVGGGGGVLYTVQMAPTVLLPLAARCSRTWWQTYDQRYVLPLFELCAFSQVGAAKILDG